VRAARHRPAPGFSCRLAAPAADVHHGVVAGDHDRFEQLRGVTARRRAEMLLVANPAVALITVPGTVLFDVDVCAHSHLARALTNDSMAIMS
jgi:hypothetical protein